MNLFGFKFGFKFALKTRRLVDLLKRIFVQNFFCDFHTPFIEALRCPFVRGSGKKTVRDSVSDGGRVTSLRLLN